jgi:cell fate (sporulation/competence/biofilm development) regulator YlbF (YheA/YmcA/DUF963 family)
VTKDQILTMAFELGAAIAQSVEIDSLKEMQIRLDQDLAASGLIQAYQEARTHMENKSQDGLEILESDVHHLDMLQEELKSNNLVQELIQVQENFNNLMQGVYFAINQAMSGEQCSSDCSSCGGSCSM